MGKTIVVERSVLAAAQELEKTWASTRDSKPLDVAERKINECRKAEDETGMKFWRSVWLHLMLAQYAPGEIKVVEDAPDQPTRPSIPEKKPLHHSAQGT